MDFCQAIKFNQLMEGPACARISGRETETVEEGRDTVRYLLVAERC